MTKGFRDLVAAYFKAHPGEWIDGLQLETIGGRYAWRSRISDCRLELGMTIENRQRRLKGGPVISEYRYQPESAAPDDKFNANDWQLSAGSDK